MGLRREDFARANFGFGPEGVWDATRRVELTGPRIITLSTETGELHDQTRYDDEPGDPLATDSPAAMPRLTTDVYRHPYENSKDEIVDRLEMNRRTRPVR